MKVLRATASLVGNWLTAAIGTAIWNAEFEHIFHPGTIRGLYIREILLSAVVAFLLGYFVFYKWRSAPAKWVWVVGVLGFTWRATLDTPSTPAATATLLSLDAVSVRAAFYSLGAWSCASIAPLIRKRWSAR